MFTIGVSDKNGIPILNTAELSYFEPKIKYCT